MMDRLGKAKLHVAFIQETNTYQTTQQCVALEQPPRIGILKGEELTSSLADLGKGKLNTPYLSLVLEAKFTNESQLLVQARLLKWPSRSCENFRPVGLNSTIHHLGGRPM